jgi:hypothetical protein
MISAWPNGAAVNALLAGKNQEGTTQTALRDPVTFSVRLEHFISTI